MKHILTALLLSITILSFGQTTMNIYQNNGTTVNLPVSTIDSVNFTTTPPPSRMNIYQMGGGIISIVIGNIDSITYTVQGTSGLAVLSTSPVTNINSTSAVSGGDIVNDGGSAVTQRGIVWSTTPNPTTANNNTIDGSGTGSFVSSLNGLTANYDYFVRAYATNANGTAYGNELLFASATSPLAIGDSYQGGIIFYLNGLGGGLIAAPTDQSSGAEWGCQGTTISGADGIAIGTGAQNTIDIEAGCSTSGTAADICANLLLSGYTDWFLPSIDELNLMYQNIGQGNALGLGNVGGFATDVEYWSSTENSDIFAYVQSFFQRGFPYSTGKGNPSYYVRAIRAF